MGPITSCVSVCVIHTYFGFGGIRRKWGSESHSYSTGVLPQYLFVHSINWFIRPKSSWNWVTLPRSHFLTLAQRKKYWSFRRAGRAWSFFCSPRRNEVSTLHFQRACSYPPPTCSLRYKHIWQCKTVLFVQFRYISTQALFLWWTISQSAFFTVGDAIEFLLTWRVAKKNGNAAKHLTW